MKMIAFAQGQIKELVDSHPLIATAELNDKLTHLASQHFVFGLTHPDSDEPPAWEVSICILIACFREIIKYREKFGPLPGEEYVSSEEEEHEQTTPEGRTPDGEGEPARVETSQTNQEQPPAGGRGTGSNPCRQPYPISESARPRHH